ncbi:MAG TPA: hypothetical protein VFU02_19635 [Polyangiaceae bacterium]|nr:hypothetical protein [Polyangiaceae bacterium]
MQRPGTITGGLLALGLCWGSSAGCQPPSKPYTCGAGGSASTGVGGGSGGQAGAGTPEVGGGEGGANDLPPAEPRDSPAAGLEVVTSDDSVTDIQIAVHERVNTVLVVRWNQTEAADATWLDFGLAGEPRMTSPPGSGALGAHREVVLGVPGDAEVSVRVVSKRGETAYQSSEHRFRTLPVPSRIPKPEVLSYRRELASSERWLFGSVEDSVGGSPYNYYLNTFWLYIIDRQGRVVWYYADPSSNATTSFQRRARDGAYIVLEKRCFSCVGFEESIVKMTLDWSRFEVIPVSGLADAIDVTSDGSVLYDAEDELRELLPDGEVRTIWSCRQHFGRGLSCYTNTINWDPVRDTVLMSYPYSGTVVEIDRKSGDLVGQYGNARGSWRFGPPESSPPEAWKFEFQHFPNFTPSGSLLVSSHMPGCTRTEVPVANQHAFVEFDVDRTRQRLTERWRYTEGPEWPRAKGMAIRLENGNTLANYGTGGVIREITPGKQTAWHVKFDAPAGDDFFNKMVGHNELIDDLYALNGPAR